MSKPRPQYDNKFKADSIIRVTLDLPETAIPEMALLADAWLTADSPMSEYKCPMCHKGDLERNPVERWEKQGDANGAWMTYQLYCPDCHSFTNADDKGPVNWAHFVSGGVAFGVRRTA